MASIPCRGFYIRFLGGFFVEYEGRRITISRELSQKAMQLLAILLKAGSRGVTRKKLVEMLESDIDGWERKLAGLRNHTYKLRKLLRESDFPKGEYIAISGGKYFFHSEYSVTSDTGLIDEMYKRLRDGVKGPERTELLRQVCRLYQGEFLPALMAEEWALIESAGYQSIYFQCLDELSVILKRQGRYTELYELCGKANAYCPCDEWRSIQIDCLMAEKRYQDAWKLYEQATEVFSRELGTFPFEQQMESYDQKALSGVLPKSFGEIKSQLREEAYRTEAYQCSYPSFMNISRLFMRLAERSRLPLLLLLCTVKPDGGGGEWKNEVLDEQMEKFRQFLAVNIRTHDIYTRYSACQFVVLLVDIEEQRGQAVMERLRNGYTGPDRYGILELEIQSLDTVRTMRPPGELQQEEKRMEQVQSLVELIRKMDEVNVGAG